MSYIERFDTLLLRRRKRKAYVKTLYTKNDDWDIDYVIDQQEDIEPTTNELLINTKLVIPKQV